MKYIKLYEEFITEGFYDKGILKAFFMAGGPGSGKSFISGELFGFDKNSVSTLSGHTGLKLINSDKAFEKFAEDAGFELDQLSDIKKDPAKWNELMSIRDRAKKITTTQQRNYIGGRLGMVIDGTGKDFTKIEKSRRLVNDLGYDTYMVFVNTSLEVAIERNRLRKRQLPEELVAEMWNEVQQNIGKYQNLFGIENMIIVDNSVLDTNILSKIEKEVIKRINQPVQNPEGKWWLKFNDPSTRHTNQPY
jgi:predicted kinase